MFIFFIFVLRQTSLNCVKSVQKLPKGTFVCGPGKLWNEMCLRWPWSLASNDLAHWDAQVARIQYLFWKDNSVNLAKRKRKVINVYKPRSQNSALRKPALAAAFFFLFSRPSLLTWPKLCARGIRSQRCVRFPSQQQLHGARSSQAIRCFIFSLAHQHTFFYFLSILAARHANHASLGHDSEDFEPMSWTHCRVTCSVVKKVFQNIQFSFYWRGFITWRLTTFKLSMFIYKTIIAQKCL
jgi:hypothetical protein